ncbi:MAG: DNA polymerase/3'-5' exonuclease PolX [Rhodospirillales bacterium]|nr:DNA polymerase/3'-5' exonuclease PolX [Rhodospirillales bacterium]
MPVHNAEVAEILNKVADLLEIEEANPFRVRAYRNAARTVTSLPQSIASMLEQNQDLSRLPGIGKDLAGKIRTIVETGGLPILNELERHTPSGLVMLLGLPGLGPKRVHALHETLGIETLDALAVAARSGRIRALPGFGAKTEKNILHALETRGAEKRRTLRSTAEAIATSLAAYLQQLPGVAAVEVAGSYRRRKETVGDLDVLVACGKDCPVIPRFVGYEDVAEVVSQGTTRSTVILRNGLQVDLRVVPERSYGAALHYFTGSKAHNIAVRKMGVAKGLKINEYGVFKGKRSLAGRSEDEVYAQVGLPYIEPELREGRGEIEAAQEGRLPRLLTLGDIRGDLHSHSRASDGHDSIEAMAKAARALGYAYLSINDHSKRVTIAHGLDAKRLARQIAEIERLNQRLDGIRVLKSSEVDILEDGSLDLPKDVLGRLDLTLCAVHSKFDLSREKQTERIIRAMDHPCFNILAHPTGRLLNARPAIRLDMERLLAAARERNCFLEVNAQPERLDLTDLHCRMAKELGVKVAISTDAHNAAGLGVMRYGVDQARRGWLEPDDVLNTRSWTDLAALLKRD